MHSRWGEADVVRVHQSSVQLETSELFISGIVYVILGTTVDRSERAETKTTNGRELLYLLL